MMGIQICLTSSSTNHVSHTMKSSRQKTFMVAAFSVYPAMKSECVIKSLKSIVCFMTANTLYIPESLGKEFVETA